MSASPSTLRQRRVALSAALQGEPILLMGHGETPRNFLLNTLPYRQDSTFLYYLGALEPHSAALIEAGGETTLFLPEIDPGDALWHGESSPRQALCEGSGAQRWRPRHSLKPGPYHALPLAHPVANAEAARLSGRELDPRRPPRGSSRPLLDAVIAQRLRRDDQELAAMRRATAVSVRAHEAAMAATQVGGSEDHLQALIEAIFTHEGMQPAYPSIVTVRGDVLHGHARGLPLQDGDLLLVDAGAEEPGGYASDITRTWPVSGRFSPRQRAVYDAVLASQGVAIERVRPGTRYLDVHLSAARSLCDALLQLGLLRGEVDSLVERGAHAVFFPHGIGHLIGLDVHDMELLGDRVGYGSCRERSPQFGLGFLRLDRDLRPGMVVTVEPGFYVIPAILRDRALRERLGSCVCWDEAERWIGFGGVRIEDDVLVTEGDPDVLSAPLLRAAQDVEAQVGSGPSASARLFGEAP